MRKIDKLEVKKPLIYICFAIMIGLINFMLLNINIKGMVIFTISFITIYLITYNRKYFCILLSFVFIGFLSSYFYYNFYQNRQDNFKIRITDTYKDHYLGIVNGRKFYIYSKQKLDENKLIYANGKFKKDIDIQSGRVGHIFVKDILKTKEDFIFKLRQINDKYYNNLKSYIGEKNAAMATALVFGDKDYLEYEDKEKLKDIGVIHLICISGFHIVFIYSILKKFIKKEISLALVFFYVVLTGLTASALRAYITLVVLEMSFKVKKNYNSIAALSLSAILILLVKPYYLLDIGFDLSYLATLGILLFNKVFQRVFYFLPKYINTSLSMSLAAQVFIYPFMIFVFKSFTMNFALGSFVLTPLIYLLLPLGIVSLIMFLLNVSILWFYSLLSIAFKIFNFLVEYLQYYSLDIFYCEEIYAVIYTIILIIFSSIYKGYLNKKFFVLCCMLIFVIFMSEFSLFTKLYLYEDTWNNALIIENGFKKVAYTSNDSDIFINKIKKENAINKVKVLKKDIMLNLRNNFNIYVNPKIKGSFIMLSNDNYDIIDLLNEDEKVVIMFNEIYIDERGQ
ncbi:ComEC/Rec2 family competence protein [Clostridium mediterraneense]|uniref:ComEC/Rec2 family competence protein n=1 Tax=Clostridium mediterraneense TaxID=1805472 RepID=UPI0008314B24|nr:ComEC/Rec2 family competence protein [Clostridium mediterraneense]